VARACAHDKRLEVHKKCLPENLMERNHLKHSSLDGQDVNIWTGVICFKVGLCEHGNQY
jgi:hypothetical protein